MSDDRHNPLADVVSIEAAAREVRMDRERVKRLCIGNGIAIRWGGTDRHPRLKVSLARLRDLIARDVYLEQNRTIRRLKQKATCDLVNC